MNAEDGKVLLLEEKLQRGALVSAVNAERMAFITAAGELLLLEDQAGREKHTFPLLRGKPEKLAMSGDGKYLAVLLKRRENELLSTIFVVRADERRIVGVFVASAEFVENIRFISDKQDLNYRQVVSIRPAVHARLAGSR